MSLTNAIQERLDQARRSLDAFSPELIRGIAEFITLIADAYRADRKVIFMGNGGSAADAQHLAGELVGRFLKERAALDAVALSTNTSIITAIGNDYGFEHTFRRQVEAIAREGDVVVGISTSGNSPNIVEALKEATRKRCHTVSLVGQSGGQMKGLAELSLCVPSSSTPRIQENHITIGHIVCELVEQELFGDNA
jgi:D-sedoheptulose 7-phosphate isomerase